MKRFPILLIVLAGAAGLIRQRVRPKPEATDPWEPGFADWMCWFLETITRPEEETS